MTQRIQSSEDALATNPFSLAVPVWKKKKKKKTNKWQIQPFFADTSIFRTRGEVALFLQAPLQKSSKDILHNTVRQIRISCTRMCFF